MIVYDGVRAGWVAFDDYRRAAKLRQTNPDQADVEPRVDLLGGLLAGRWADDDPAAPR